MDFFGFHPLYVVILLALALIIFGPSRLPKMGAQVGKMLREFQTAREGITQQMRDAFEENDSTTPDFETPSAFAEDDTATESETSGDGAVAVLDPPESGDEEEEASGESAESDLIDPPATDLEAAAPDTAPVLDPPAFEPEASVPSEPGVVDPPAPEPETAAPEAFAGVVDPPAVETPVASAEEETESH